MHHLNIYVYPLPETEFVGSGLETRRERSTQPRLLAFISTSFLVVQLSRHICAAAA